MVWAAAGTAVPLKFYKEKHDEKIFQAREEISKTMVVQGIPGLSIGVSIKGKTVWKAGFGYSNIESSAKCTGKIFINSMQYYFRLLNPFLNFGF
ncbi:unnamed protein product [Caenorhabditis angaria]|uniref:Beta-lactamase-related domain-containing protein n=1 Tax=Caenorhabditis angaria TaxID=860376 RepID=A0A9P1ISD6_9PELO|nr:unnamed protein product [Caenorhabditis angaria]